MPDIFFVLRTAHFLCAVIWIGFGYALTFVMRPIGRKLASSVSGPSDPRISLFADIVAALLRGYRAGSWGTVGLGFALFFFRLNAVQSDPAARSALLKSDWGLWVMTGMSSGLLMAALAWMVVEPGLSRWIRSLRAAGWSPVPKQVVWASWTNVALSILTLSMMAATAHGGRFWIGTALLSAVATGVLTGVIVWLAARCSSD